DQIQHPAVRECIRFTNFHDGIEVIHAGDLPARSGIGSSSSFTVGLLHAIYALQGKMVTKRKLACDAIYIEQEMIKENVGSQDQFAAAFGGINKIEFSTDGSIWVTPLTIGTEKILKLQSSLLLYFTGLSRNASEVAAEQIRSTKDKISELKNMKKLTEEAIEVLNGPIERYDDFGRLLHENWKIKKSLTSRISNSFIDDIYEKAMKNGALGGKLCGAGGGGFVLFFVPPEKQTVVKEALKDLLLVPFRFEFLGSHIIFYST
ncbi:TPA: kinase, partial [bacterium]|nr:kinase [bacterium]